MILYKTDVCLQAYKHRVLEGCSYKTPSTSVFDSVLNVEEKVTIEVQDSHHNTISRLATFAQITYRSKVKIIPIIVLSLNIQQFG